MMNKRRCNYCAKWISEGVGPFLSSENGIEGYFCGWPCFNAWKYGEGESVSKKEWISIEHEEPPLCTNVLLCIEYVNSRVVAVGLRSYDGSYEDARQVKTIEGLVTHWQSLSPLPEKPVKEETPRAGHCRDCRYWNVSDSAGISNGWNVCELSLRVETRAKHPQAKMSPWGLGSHTGLSTLGGLAR